jgi:hypothetical protein
MAARGVIDVGDGTKSMAFEWLWIRVKRWAKRNGHTYDYSHVHGVGAL